MQLAFHTMCIVQGVLGLGDSLIRGVEPGQMGDNLTAVFLGEKTQAISVGGAWYQTCAVYRDAANRTQGVSTFWSGS